MYIAGHSSVMSNGRIIDLLGVVCLHAIGSGSSEPILHSIVGASDISVTLRREGKAGH